MMKILFKILLLLLPVACSTKKVEVPQGAGLNLELATTGVDRFENYIRSLNIYAFRQLADGSYVYNSTLAELDSLDIAALQDGSTRGDSKLFTTRLAVGKYRLIAVGNGLGDIAGNLQEGVTLPGDLTISGNVAGENKVYFLGNTAINLVSDLAPPFRITLSRAVSRLLLVLNGVPSQIREVDLAIGNIASRIGIDGSLSASAMNIEKSYSLDGNSQSGRDTVVYSLLTFPTVGQSSPFSITFHSATGEEVTKDMPPLAFLPDKYIRVTATISNAPGSLVSFDVAIHYFIFDSWQDINLPDFPLTPRS